MDTEKAETLLLTEGETANSVGKAGTLIKNPDVLVDLEVNGTYVHENSAYGCFNPVDEGHLDYFVHRMKDITLKEKTRFYRENDVKVHLYIKKNENKITTKTVKATSDGWTETDN